MTTPLNLNTRPGGANIRTGEVMLLPMFMVLPLVDGGLNLHDNLTEDIICNDCIRNGTFRPIPGPVPVLRQFGQVYLWHLPTAKRNHRCRMCRLIWRTFRPFYEYFEDKGHERPVVVLGFCDFWKDRTQRRTNLVAMRFKKTMDNEDVINLRLRPEEVKCYVYEHEQIPRFTMTHPMSEITPTPSTDTTYQHTKRIKADEIDFNTLKGWLTSCEFEHGSVCGVAEGAKPLPNNTAAAHTLPKRLIDVKGRCVIQTAALSGDESITRYLALSYVWADGGAAPFKLTRADASQCSVPGYIRDLGDKIPQKIRDSLHVCDKMHVRYLWVDALCIVQDDEAEKAAEISRMDAIYSNARAVLAIAADSTCIPGILGRKRDLVYNQEEFGDEAFMTSLSSTTWTARISKWNTRAWTFQECMLAKRIIFLTDSYAFFRCSSAFCREDDAPEPVSSHKASELMDSGDRWVVSGLHDIPSGTSAGVVFDTLYKPMLRAYLCRSMTYDTDAVVAFSGILKVLSRYMGDFHFGLPHRYFGVALLWNDPNRGLFRRRHAFPSWSWAGWEWDFRFSGSEKNDQGPYESQKHEAIVPLTVFQLGQQTGKLEVLFDDEAVTSSLIGDEALMRREKMEIRSAQVDSLLSSMALGYEEGIEQLHNDVKYNRIKVRTDEVKNAAKHQRERDLLLLQLRPPTSHLDTSYINILSRHKKPSHLIAFYTSVATLKIAKVATRAFAQGSTHVYGVTGKDDEGLFPCYLDPKYREGKKGEDFEFAAIGFRPGGRQVVLMLLERDCDVDIDAGGGGDVGVYYRANWACNASQLLYVEDWQRQDPKQKLVILG